MRKGLARKNHMPNRLKLERKSPGQKICFEAIVLRLISVVSDSFESRFANTFFIKITIGIWIILLQNLGSKVIRNERGSRVDFTCEHFAARL